MSICLTKEELQEITGFVKHTAQACWLRAQGFTFKLRADGMPIVSRMHFEDIMAGLGCSTTAHEVEPDFSIFQ